MRGHMRMRGAGTWRLYAWGYAADGRRRQITRTFHGGKRDAQRALAAFVAEVDARPPSPSQPLTFSELVSRWLANADIAPGTSADYERVARIHLEPHIGGTPLTGVTPAVLDDTYRTLRAGGVSAHRVQRAHTVVRSAFNQAIRWGLVDVNPARSASPPQPKRPKMTPASTDQVKRLLAAATPEMRCYLTLAATLGSRRGEIAALRWSDFDLDAPTVRLERAVAVAKGTGYVVKDTKTDHDHKLGLDAVAVADVRAHWAREAESALAIGYHLGGDSYLFHPWGDPSRPTRPDLWTHRFIRLRRRLGLTVRLHDIRHYVATELLAAGHDPVTVSRRLGHSKVSTTLDIYGHPVDANDRAAAEMLGRRLG